MVNVARHEIQPSKAHRFRGGAVMGRHDDVIEIFEREIGGRPVQVLLGWVPIPNVDDRPTDLFIG